ncbi:serine hydrolase domain-containing protein [Brevundimonas sp. FT23042]|uniref:serine hydrolase domain-containing protein n=1 Tax=Brevundimonas sp. FT23042 TaxID=3393749 RepID=UPI003B58988F
MRARTAMGALTLTAAVADDNGVWSGRQGEGAHPLHWWASAGKMATAIAVLQMVEEDRVSLDDPVSRWIEGVPLGDRITVRMLLDHTSGLFSANEAPPVRAAPRYRTLPELVEVARAEGSLFCPGESWRYSNTNYWLLGGIIETVDGVPLAEALDRRVIQRAGLRDIRILSPTDTLADVAPAGPPNIEAGEIAANPAWVGAAGPLVATPEAMIGLLHALLSGRLLKPETVQTQLAEAWPMFGQPQFYGLGLMAYEPPDRAGALWVGHSGGAPGARAIVVWSPTDQAFAAVALTGAGSPEAVANRLLQLRAATR